jgi:predicted  nucleic acid-binding Zn-ribbon protein
LLTTTLLSLSLLGAAAEESSRINPDLEAIGTSAGDSVGQNELQSLLPLLLTSEDRRQLAANLEVFIRKGDLRAAETSLNTAIEVGTLAIVLVDHLKDPDLLRALESFNNQTASYAQSSASIPAAVASSDACATSGAAASANLADLQQALEQERSSSTMISQTLTALMREHNALAAQLESDATSQDSRWTEMQQALEQEQERSKVLKQELASLQERYQSMQAARKQDKAPPADASAEARLQQEQAQSDQTAHQLAVALKDLRELQSLKDEIVASATSRTSELETALAQTRMRSEVLTRELAIATGELQALKESRQPSPTPVMFRPTAAGAEPPMAPLPESAPPATVEAAASLPERAPAQPEAASVPPAQNPATVVVASMPEGVQPLAMPVPGTLSAHGAEPARADDRLVSRANELLRKSDVSGARLLLERALAGGNARAAFLLGESFDPNVLSKLGALGIRGDAAKARELYAQAKALGMVQAGERIEALK